MCWVCPGPHDLDNGRRLAGTVRRAGGTNAAGSSTRNRRPRSYSGGGGEVEPESLCALLGQLDGLLWLSWRRWIRSGIKQPVAPEANAAPENKHQATEQPATGCNRLEQKKATCPPLKPAFLHGQSQPLPNSHDPKPNKPAPTPRMIPAGALPEMNPPAAAPPHPVAQSAMPSTIEQPRPDRSTRWSS